MFMRVDQIGFRATLVLLAASAWLLATGCANSSTVGGGSPVLPAPIAEARFVEIGGIEQWVTIRGDDRSNPIVLVVHGGPGNPLSPIADSLFMGWEKDFTIVHWDQRGAGRTYSRNDPLLVAPTMTVEQIARDGLEVAEYLTEHLGQSKVTIFATSWGSVVGVHMARARPDLFNAYVGHSQFVSWKANLDSSYRQIHALATEAGDAASLATLEELGPPPWTRITNWPRYRRIYVQYQKQRATAPGVPITLSAEYASDQEQAKYSEAEDFSFEHFWGMTLSGPLTQVDLPSLGTTFEIPMIVVQGEEDLWTLPDVARGYHDSLNAPEKEFFLIEGAGHGFSKNAMDKIADILRQRTR